MKFSLKRCLAALLLLTAVGVADAHADPSYDAMITNTPDVQNYWNTAGTDLVGGANFSCSGTCTGGQPLQSRFVGTKFGPAAGSYAQAAVAPYSQSGGTPNDMAIEASFIAPNSTTPYCMMTTEAMKLCITSGQLSLSIQSLGGWSTLTSPASTYGDGAPHHLVINVINPPTYGGGNTDLEMWLDGTFVSDISPSLYDMPTPTAGWSWGGGLTLPNFPGTLGGIAKYSHHLSPEVIAAHHTCAIGGACNYNPGTCNTPPGDYAIVWCDNFDTYTSYATLPSPWTSVAGDLEASDSVFWSTPNALAMGNNAFGYRPLPATATQFLIDADILFLDNTDFANNFIGAFSGGLPLAGIYFGNTGSGMPAGSAGGFLVVQGSVQTSSTPAFYVSLSTWHHVQIFFNLSVNPSLGYIALFIDGTKVAQFNGVTAGYNISGTNANLSADAIGVQATGNAFKDAAFIDNLGVSEP